MKTSPLPMATFGLVILTQQSRASMVEQLRYLSRRNAQPQMQYDLNTIKTCTWWYDNYEGRSCEVVRDWMYYISPKDFARWNPSVTEDCGNWRYGSYCVEVLSEQKPSTRTAVWKPSTTTPTSTTSTRTTAKAKPTLLAWEPLGCYIGSNTLSTRSSKAGGSGLTVDNCKEACFDDNFRFAGVTAGTECWCGTYVPTTWSPDKKDCNTPCAGDASQICGGTSVFNVFEAQYKLRPPSTTRTKARPLPSSATTTTAGATATTITAGVTATSQPLSNPSATPTSQPLSNPSATPTANLTAKVEGNKGTVIEPRKWAGLASGGFVILMVLLV